MLRSTSATQMIGTTTNDNAPAGVVGEYVSANLASGSAISLSTGVVANITNISLTAGDWDLSGVVLYHSASGTTIPADVKQGISTTSATMGAQGNFSYDYIGIALSATDDPAYTTPVVRVSISATTTVYLVCDSDFSVSTLTAYGFVRARRVR